MYADKPFARAISIMGVMRPALSRLWTCGRRPTDARTPRATISVVASSDALRGIIELGTGGSSSVAARPGVEAIVVPEVTTRGLSDPTSSDPSASIARLSAWQLSMYFEKS